MGRYEDILWYSLGEDVKEATIFPLGGCIRRRGRGSMAFYNRSKIKSEPTLMSRFKAT